MFVTATVPLLMKLLRAIIQVQHVMACYKLCCVVDCTKITAYIEGRGDSDGKVSVLPLKSIFNILTISALLPLLGIVGLEKVNIKALAHYN